MNKLNSPIVILCLIIATLISSILSVISFNKINTTETITTNPTADIDINTDDLTEPFQQVYTNFTIIDTRQYGINVVEGNSDEVIRYKYVTWDDYEYSDVEYDKIFNELFSHIIRGCRRICVSCTDVQCEIEERSGYVVYPPTKIYSSDISATILDKLKNQQRNEEEIVSETLIERFETSTGQIIYDVKEIPRYVLVVNDSNELVELYNSHTHIYTIDEDLFEYISSLV